MGLPAPRVRAAGHQDPLADLEEAAFAGPGKVWAVMSKARKGGRLHPIDADFNHIIATARAKVEHPFQVVKRQFGYAKTRYRGLAKDRAQFFTPSRSASCSRSGGDFRRQGKSALGAPEGRCQHVNVANSVPFVPLSIP